VVLVVAVVAVVFTVAAFHAVLAQNQVRLERLRARIAAAEKRYEAARLVNGRLSSPARITQRAAEMGLVPPAVSPIAVPVPGEVPRRGGASSTLADWVEVKPHLDAAP
jgi:type II secretory pathway pseudopilin PulG